MNSRPGRKSLCALAAFACASAHAATIQVTIDPTELAGTGFGDPTVVAPVGDNLATTLGAQRLFVFQKAAAQWGNLINSSVTITVRAKMASITNGCGGTSAILGQAGPTAAYRDFPNSPKAGVFYASALADSLRGSANPNSSPQIDANFNVNLDTGTCLNGKTWWYDTNPSHAIPSGRIALLPVVFHELGHGLGFITFTNLQTGAFVNGFPDISNLYLFDQQQNKTWAQINPSGGTNATIVGSATNGTNLVWAGKHVNKAQKDYLSGSPSPGTHNGCVNMYAPATLENGSSVSHWTKTATPALLMQPVLNQKLFDKVDLTLPLFQDIGWSTNVENVLFSDGFDSNPCANVQP